MFIQLKSFPPIQVDTIAEYAPSATAEIADIRCVADVAGSLGGRYFHLYAADNATVFTFWFDVASGNTAPVVKSTTIIEVDISSGDTAQNVASALQTAIAAQSAFGAIVKSGADDDVVQVTNAANGSARLAHDPIREINFLTEVQVTARETGFTFTEDTKGISNNSLPASLTLYRITGRTMDHTAHQDGNRFDEDPYATKTIDIIVDIRQFLQLIED